MEVSIYIETNFDKNANKNLKTLARIAGSELKKIDGPRVAVFEVFGFDTHAAQGGADGEHGQKLKQVDHTFDVLKKTLGNTFKNTLIITLTEFGRTLVQNNGYGTEHGYGTSILLGGGLVKKSQVYADWPGIKNKNLFKFNTSFVVSFFKIVLASIIMGIFFNYLIFMFKNQLIYDSYFKSFYLIFSVLLTLSFYLLLSFFIKAFNYKDLQLRY